MQAAGWVDALITQNVDRLHTRAGSADVLELHGTTHRCCAPLSCALPCLLVSGGATDTLC